MKNKKLLLLFFGIFIFMIIPKNVYASATGLRVYQRNSDNTGWIQNANLNTTCYLNQNALIRGQLLRFDFNDTLTNGTTYDITFNISTQSTLDYAYFRWDNSFNAGGLINLSVGSYFIREPQVKQTLALSTIPMSNYTLYSKSSKIVFTVTPSNTGTFSLDLPTYLLSYSQICLDSYNVRASSSQANNQDIIDNQNSNTQTIINNNNSNTSSIINNQNENTDKQIESQKVCSRYSSSDIVTDNYYLSSNGTAIYSTAYGLSSYIKLSPTQEFIIVKGMASSSAYSCFLDSNKSTLSCFSLNATGDDVVIPIPDSASYVRLSFNKSQSKPIYDICKNGNQAISDGINDLNNNITNDNVDGSIANADGNIDGFEINSHGLGDIFNTLVTFIGNVANSTCTALTFTLPFVHNEVTLPCMSSIYTTHFPTFFTLYQLITTGLIAYRVIINLFQKVKQLSDPNYDKIEVIQL